MDPKEGLLLGVPAGLTLKAPASSAAASAGAAGMEDDEDEAAENAKAKANKKRAKEQGSGMMVGCYVPLARVASAETRGAGASADGSSSSKTGSSNGWRLDKSFEVGESVRCRVVAANIFEGACVCVSWLSQRERE